MLTDSQNGTDNDNLISQARAFYGTQDLPDAGLPQGFLALDRLLGDCVASFGVEVLEPDLARQSGVYYFRAGDQLEYVDAIREACEGELASLGLLLPPSQEMQTIRYEAYLTVYNCLVQNGYPTEPPPSLDVFLEQPNGWTPWKGMIGDASPVLPTEGMQQSSEFGEYLRSLSVCPRP